MLSCRFRFAHLGLAVGLLSACGGSDRPAETSGEKAASRSSDSPPSDDARTSSDETDTPAPKRATCDDGTCTPCGDALCPTGWYCDESARGGPACGWLPECAAKAGCGCVKKALGCACEEKSGGVHVVCG